MMNTANVESGKLTSMRRRYPIGAEITSGGVHFRVWAPGRRQVEVVCREGRPGEDATYPLGAEGNGYFSGIAPVSAGTQYRFRLDGGGELLPDPASRWQPDGPFGWSQVIDPDFAWSDDAWQGGKLAGQILYEMHIGTFSKEGTWKAAAAELAELASFGITVLEVMPVADFAGSFGWGYDGVNFFAPCRLYGSPDDFRSFVNAAHALGIAVILDVVYNHAGPSGNYLGQFSKNYFTSRYGTDWGEAINFDGEESGPVREFFTANAAYWVDEFHIDGLRLDATQNIYDSGPVHILEQIVRAVRRAARGRDTIVVAENEPQESKLVRPGEKDGYGLDGIWNDDFHHSASVALTGKNEAYYSDYSGHAQEFVSALKYGFLFQGQTSGWQHKGRGTPSYDIEPPAFILFLENHDQVSNSARGLRMHRMASPGRMRAMTAVLLLAPGTPMLFQGQEFGASTPFAFFADHDPELSGIVAKGRAQFLSQFRSVGSATVPVTLADPGDRETFLRCKLNFAERASHAEAYALHKDLIRLRAEDPVFQVMPSLRIDGAALSDRTFVVRYFAPDLEDRVLLVNLDMDLHWKSIPEPLLAPPPGTQWRVLFSTEHPKYGGAGIYEPDQPDGWHLPGESAVLLSPVRSV
jgi:maltooligosyltrehalose trehalohydrolase